MPNQYYKGRIFDHKGNEFKTVKEMCESYGIKLSTFLTRRKQFNLEDSLTSPVRCIGKRHPNVAKCKYGTTDHTGRKFNSFKAMCESWGLSAPLVSKRLSKNPDLKDALETPVDGKKREAALKGLKKGKPKKLIDSFYSMPWT